MRLFHFHLFYYICKSVFTATFFSSYLKFISQCVNPMFQSNFYSIVYYLSSYSYSYNYRIISYSNYRRKYIKGSLLVSISSNKIVRCLFRNARRFEREFSERIHSTYMPFYFSIFSFVGISRGNVVGVNY